MLNISRYYIQKGSSTIGRHIIVKQYSNRNHLMYVLDALILFHLLQKHPTLKTAPHNGLKSLKIEGCVSKSIYHRK